MNFPNFLKALFHSGKIDLPHIIPPITEAEELEAALILENEYERFVQDTYHPIPAYHSKAAMWSAKYIYRTAFALLLRDKTPKELKEMLLPYKGRTTPSTIISIDICMKSLPDLMMVARGIAPNDPLIQILNATCHKWPLSTIRIKQTNPSNLTQVKKDDSLFNIYLDRIIRFRRKDLWKKDEDLQEKIKERIGESISSI